MIPVVLVEDESREPADEARPGNQLGKFVVSNAIDHSLCIFIFRLPPKVFPSSSNYR